MKKILQKDLVARLKEFENMNESERKIRSLKFVVENAYEDLNKICHLMSFMEEKLEEENIQLSKCIAAMHFTVANVAISLLEEL